MPSTTLHSRCPLALTLLCALCLLPGCSDPSRQTLLTGVPEQVDFNWHVRPILSDKCLACHGPDADGREAGLRLDLRATALAELPESPGRFAIVAGDPGQSELISRITADNPDERMPPASSHKTLSATDIEILRRWIAQGAEYKQHWAFLSPQLPALPQGDLAATAHNPVDNFIHARLAAEQLAPAAAADRETLINRVSLTLTGLPPTLAQVDRFMTDPDPAAYETLVDELLAAPAYAEHMASYWLDLARWSESDGFLDDHHDRFLWPWRDWVIAAFNSNMPFNQFGTWQLAGDLLPEPTRDQLLATTFLRIGKRTTENGAIEAEYKAETMVERTDNALGTTFLGLTLACARCHDHRYDPVSQKAYYQLGAFFNTGNEPGVYAPGFSGIQGGTTLPWPDADTQARIEATKAEAEARANDHAQAVATARLQAETTAASLPGAAALQQRLSTLLTAASSRALAAHYPLDSATAATIDELPPPQPRRFPPASINTLPNGPYAPPLPGADETPAQRLAREQRELQGRVPRNYNADELTLSPAASPTMPAAVLQAPLFRPGVQGQALFFDDNNKGFLGPGIGWYERTEPFSIDFWFNAAAEYEDATILNHRSEQNSGQTGYQLNIENGRLRLTLAHSPPANMIGLSAVDPLPVQRWLHLTLTYDGSSSAAGVRLYQDGQALALVVTHDSLSRTMLPWNSGDIFDPFVGLAFGTRFRARAPVGSGLDEIRVYSRELQALEVAWLHDAAVLEEMDIVELQSGLAALLVDRNDTVARAQQALVSARTAHNNLVSAVPQVLVMGEAPHPPATHVLERGVYSALGEPVEAQGLATVFPWDPQLPRNRLGLAQWLFDPAHPLTARVFVNRIWQLHFGQGLVETSEDFGSQGSIPTHPELLDWLTLQFIDSGWDVKALHRLIVTSGTYRQQSVPDAALAARDPANTLYARGPRWRMTAEMVRDNALTVSGLLVDRQGGPSVQPYQPDGIWNPLNSFYAWPPAATLPADAHHRRTLYTFIKRNAVHPALKIFDFRNRTESLARRRSSNTPLQALNLMNDPQFVEAYRQLAAVVLTQADTTETRLAMLYRLATRSRATPPQLETLGRYHASQLALFAENPHKATALLGNGVTPPDASLDPVALAAMSNVAAVVMNSPDAYTVR